MNDNEYQPQGMEVIEPNQKSEICTCCFKPLYGDRQYFGVCAYCETYVEGCSIFEVE